MGSWCSSCGREGLWVRPVRTEGAAQQICARCGARTRQESCSACGQSRRPRRRNADGTATCGTCVRRALAEVARTADRELIAAAVSLVEPDLAPRVVAAAISTAARDTRQLRHLAEGFVAEPECLVSASSRAPRELDRLVVALRHAGAARVRPPRCAVCGRTVRELVGRTGRRVCSRCDAVGRAEACAACGQVRVVARRQGDGSALCTACADSEPRFHKICSMCGRLAHISQRREGEAVCSRCYRPPEATCSACGKVRPCSGVRDGRPLCAGCQPRRQATCSGCSRLAPVAVVWAGGPVCSTCYERTLAAKGTCEGCGMKRRIDPRDPSDQDLCSDCAGLPALAVCEGCGGEDRIWRNRRCFACNLTDRLDVLLAGPDGRAPSELARLHVALGGAASPRAILRWLAIPRVAATLSGLPGASWH